MSGYRGYAMFKKAISFLAAIFFSIVSCNGLLMEILQGDFSFIVDTQKKTAMIRKIYIPAHTKKDVVIPKYVTDYRGDKYTVTEIKEDAVKEVIPRIKSFMARDEFMMNERNYKALTWILIYNLPLITVGKSETWHLPNDEVPAQRNNPSEKLSKSFG